MDALLNVLEKVYNQIEKLYWKQSNKMEKFYALLMIILHKKSDREIVLQAVQKNGIALEYASKSLQSDREIVLEAIKQNASIFCFNNSSFKSDRDFILEAVEHNENAFKWVEDIVRNGYANERQQNYLFMLQAIMAQVRNEKLKDYLQSRCTFIQLTSNDLILK